MTRFFERYTQLCKEAGKSANGAAKELGISSGTVSQWKTGSVPRKDTIEKIAGFFNVTSDYLLGYTDQKEKLPAEDGSIREQAARMIDSMSADELLEFMALATKKLQDRQK